MEATNAGHKIGVITLCVGSASVSSLLACHLCLPPERGSYCSDRSLLWGNRYRAFVAGLLLGTALIEAFPFMEGAFSHLYKEAAVIVLYPLPNVCVCFGFLLAWSLFMVMRYSCCRNTSCCSHDGRPVAENCARNADIELQVRRCDVPPKVADVSSSEEDILYDSGEVWTPLVQNGIEEGTISETSHAIVTPTAMIGPISKCPDHVADSGEDDDEEREDSAVTRLLSDPTIEASKAELAAQEEEEAASLDFIQSYIHIGVSFAIIGAFTRPISIWLLGFGMSCYISLATHQLCAYLIKRFNLILLFGFSFCAATVTSASGMSIGMFLVAEVDQISWHIFACLVWGFAAGCQLFASCLLTAHVINNRSKPLHVVISMLFANFVIAITKLFDG